MNNITKAAQNAAQNATNNVVKMVNKVSPVKVEHRHIYLLVGVIVLFFVVPIIFELVKRALKPSAPPAATKETESNDSSSPKTAEDNVPSSPKESGDVKPHSKDAMHHTVPPSQ